MTSPAAAGPPSHKVMNTMDTICVFTARSPDRIVAEKGSQAWVLNPSNAKAAKWLVVTQNLHHKNHEFSDATEPHGSAFMVAKIAGLKKCDEDGAEDRWLIEISEYARIAKPDVWQWRNPVKYTTLEDLGIDLAGLKFVPIPKDASPSPLPSAPAGVVEWPPATLTIAQAKQALAATFGVKPEAVEISIRG